MARSLCGRRKQANRGMLLRSLRTLSRDGIRRSMLRTKSGLPKHCGWNTDRHGRRRVRFRLRGFSTYLTGTPWSEDFMRQYAAALEGVRAPNIGAERTIAGTVNALVAAYLD